MSNASQAGEVFLGAPEHFKDWWNGFKAGLSEKNAHLLMFSHRVEADQPGVTPEEKDFGYGLAASAETIWLSKILSTTDYKSWTKGQEIEHELQQLELQASAVTSDDEEEAGARSEAGSITQVSAATAAAIARVNKAVAMHIAGAELALYDRLIKCLSKLVVNARFKLLQAMLVKNKGTIAIQALLSFYGGISKEMAANIFARAFGKIDQARTLDQHCATSMNMQETIVDMGAALPGLSLEQVAALYQLYIMKAFGDPATINIATKHLEAFKEGVAISLADLGNDIQLSKVFADGVRGQQVPGFMGAATNVPRQVLGNFPAPATAPRINYPPGSLEPCRLCAAKGIDFRCKASEWRDHAKTVHPRPPRTNPRGSGGGAPSQTRQPFLRRSAVPTLAALQAHVDTLDPAVEVFALSGTIFQLVGDEIVTIGSCADVVGVKGSSKCSASRVSHAASLETVPAIHTRVTFKDTRSTKVQLAYVDSGAGRVITNDVLGARGALQPSNLRVRSATGITAPVRTGIYALKTQPRGAVS